MLLHVVVNLTRGGISIDVKRSVWSKSPVGSIYMYIASETVWLI